MSVQERRSRLDKYNKRRKNTRKISILILIAGILVVILLFTFIFGGKDKDEEPGKASEANIEEKENENTDEGQDKNDDEEIDTDESLKEEDEDEDKTDVQLKEVSSSDSNVSEAYEGDWEPIGTEQSEPHETVFDKDSEDWKEMEEAVRVATGLDEMITFYIENGGDDTAIATVTSTDESEKYRVTISWVKEEGWQPILLEELIENDKN